MVYRLRWVLLPVSLVVGLAAVLRTAGPGVSGSEEIGRIIRLPRPLTYAVLLLFGLAAVVFVVGAVRRMRSRRERGLGELEPAQETPMPAWLRTLTQILSLVNFVVIAYLIWRGVVPLTDLLTLGQNAMSGLAGTPDELGFGAPALVTWTFGVLAVVAALGALGLALWVAFGDRLIDWWTRADEPAPRPRPSAADELVDDPRGEPDPRRAIMRSYARFERVAARAGVGRQPSVTPMEFMREVLQRWPPWRDAVPTLTSLFELARFSRRALGGTERERALAALDEITTPTEGEREDVRPR